MTCIVALRAEHVTWMGGDRGQYSGEDKSMRASPKVTTLTYRVGDYTPVRFGTLLMGVAGSGRVSDILLTLWTPPANEFYGDCMGWLLTDVIPSVRTLLREHGVVEVKDSLETFDGEFLLAVEGRIFKVWSDFCVTEKAQLGDRFSFEVAGVGGRFAAGALQLLAFPHSLDHVWTGEGMEVVHDALKVAARSSAYVDPPFDILSRADDEGADERPDPA